LDDGLDDFSFRNRDEQRDGAIRRGRKFLFLNRQHEGIFRGAFDVAKKFIARAVEDGHAFAALNAENMKGVMRLASVQPQQLIAAARGRKKKTVRGHL
jgi:hypothetical protein